MSRRKRTVSIPQWAALAGLAEDGRSVATARALIMPTVYQRPQRARGGRARRRINFRQFNEGNSADAAERLLG